MNIPAEAWTAFGFILVLLLRGHLVLTEFSLVNLRYSDLDAGTLEQLRSQKKTAFLLKNLARVGEVIRLGRKLSSFATGGLLFLLFVIPGREGQMILPLVLAVVVGVLLQIMVSDMVPRFMAGQNPQKYLAKGAWAVFFFWVLGWPILKIQDWLRGRLKVWTQQDSGYAMNPLDVEVQIRAMGEDSAAIPPVVRQILSQTLQIDELVVQDILLPRNQVVILDTKVDGAENLETARKAGHTRYPICDGDLDHCLGIIHIKDIFRFRADWERINLQNFIRPIISFSTEDNLVEVFPKMLRNRIHMALAKDQFGGVVGVVTLEKIIETMVGEIHDEFDQEELLIKSTSRGTYHISGLAPLHDVEEELGLAADVTDEVSTFGGLIIAELGRIPTPGEAVEFRGLKVRVLEADDRRVLATEVQKVQPEDGKGAS